MIARVRAPRTRVHAYMYMQWLHALCLSIRGMYVGAAASLHSFLFGLYLRCAYVAVCSRSGPLTVSRLALAVSGWV